MKNRIIAVLIIGLLAIILTGCNSKSDRLSYKYGNTMIEILNSYKDGKITAKDAGRQIDDLSDKAKAESDRIKDSDFDESHRLTMISTIGKGAYTDLYFRESMSILSINEAIKDIEEQIK